jgi:periplasmic mercuric ion binding protein
MKQPLNLAMTALLLLAPLSAQAGEQIVILEVHHADCVLCAPIVKTTLQRVPGVKAVNVFQPDDMADVEARVTFDDSATNVSALIAATTKAGYPSALQQ